MFAQVQNPPAAAAPILSPCADPLLSPCSVQPAVADVSDGGRPQHQDLGRSHWPVQRSTAVAAVSPCCADATCFVFACHAGCRASSTTLWRTQSRRCAWTSACGASSSAPCPAKSRYEFIRLLWTVLSRSSLNVVCVRFQVHNYLSGALMHTLQGLHKEVSQLVGASFTSITPNVNPVTFALAMRLQVYLAGIEGSEELGANCIITGAGHSVVVHSEEEEASCFSLLTASQFCSSSLCCCDATVCCTDRGAGEGQLDSQAARLRAG